LENLILETKQLGNTELQVPPIVFGGNVFGWTLDHDSSLAMLDDVFERGFNAIDTADAYSRWVDGNSGGESESIIGHWMSDRRNRDSITLITKVGYDMGQGHVDLTRDYILKACEDSLRRLQTDRIDLYFSHFDAERTPVAETLRAYEDLVTSGKVRVIGASNLSPDRIEESLRTSQQLGVAAYQVIQPEYNLYDREKFEQQYAPLAQQHQLGVLTYFSLACGFLTGKYQNQTDLDQSHRGSRVEKYLHDDRANAIVAAIQQIAADQTVQPAAVALAWLLKRNTVTAPIASATKASHLDAFEQAVALDLSDEELRLLDIK